jgi:hypothetical protein
MDWRRRLFEPHTSLPNLLRPGQVTTSEALARDNRSIFPAQLALHQTPNDVLPPPLRRLVISRYKCSSFYPGNGEGMFTQFLETEQIAIPVLLGRHIGFRPTRPGEVGKRFPIITLSLILLWLRRPEDRCRSAVRLAGRLTAGMRQAAVFDVGSACGIVTAYGRSTRTLWP